VDEATELLRDILLHSDRQTIEDIRSQLQDLQSQLHDRDRLTEWISPVFNRVMAHNVRETQPQLVAAMYPLFFPLMRRAVGAWFQRLFEPIRNLLPARSTSAPKGER
jgi:hypothetical protein